MAIPYNAEKQEKTEERITPLQRQAAEKAIEAGRQMQQAKKEGDAKTATEKATEVVKETEKYLKEKLKER
jgi:hypothetical protein